MIKNLKQLLMPLTLLPALMIGAGCRKAKSATIGPSPELGFSSGSTEPADGSPDSPDALTHIGSANTEDSSGVVRPSGFELISASPSDGAVNVPAGFSVSLVFNADLDLSTLNESSVLITVGDRFVENSPNLIDKNAATLAPKWRTFFGQTVHVRLLSGPSGVRSVDGRPLSADVLWSFTTGSVLQDLSYSYFSPAVGSTVGLQYGMPASLPKSTKSLPYAVAVVSDIGTSISITNADTSLRCRRDLYPVAPRSITLKDSELYTVGGSQILVIGSNDCEVHRVLEPYANEQLAFVHPLGNAQYLLGINDTPGAHQVRIWSETEGTTWTSSIETAYARDALIDNGDILIADTFNQRVVSLNIDTGAQNWETPSFYPNEVKIFSDSEVLLVEEHSNRLVALNIKTREKRLIAGCDLPLFLDPKISMEELEAGLGATAASRDHNASPKSACAREYSGFFSLYSPNGVAQSEGGDIIVADTDNHRIVVFSKAGAAKGEIVGFNNPVSVLAIPDSRE